MRCIDADKLYPDCLTKYGRLAISQSQIANAPTVETTKAEHKAYNEGFKDGVDQGIKLSERPQGQWIIVKDEKYGDNVKCPFCGKELAGTDLNFCVKCGASMMKGGKE